VVVLFAAPVEAPGSPLPSARLPCLKTPPGSPSSPLMFFSPQKKRDHVGLSQTQTEPQVRSP